MLKLSLLAASLLLPFVMACTGQSGSESEKYRGSTAGGESETMNVDTNAASQETTPYKNSTDGGTVDRPAAEESNIRTGNNTATKVSNEQKAQAAQTEEDETEDEDERDRQPASVPINGGAPSTNE